MLKPWSTEVTRRSRDDFPLFGSPSCVRRFIATAYCEATRERCKIELFANNRRDAKGVAKRAGYDVFTLTEIER